MWRAGAVGGARYTTAAVAGGWAGALAQKPLAKRQKSKLYTNHPTDQSTDQPTDQQKDL